MTEFSPGEQDLLDDLVRRRTTSFTRPLWMQRHRARAVEDEARRLMGESPKPVVPPGDRAHYNAAARVRAIGRRGSSYKIHEAGSDGRPICTMGQDVEWKGQYLDAGPVTCGKCAAARSP